MDVWGITLATLRRWYVFVPVLALTALVAWRAGAGIAPEYEATASFTLTPPRVAAEVANPLGSTEDATAAMVIVLNSADVRNRVEARRLPTGYTATAQNRTSIITVQVLGADEEGVVETAAELVEITGDELLAAQEGGEPPLPVESRIGVRVLSSPTIVTVGTESALRVQAVVLVVGGALALALSVLFDDLVNLVRRSRLGRQRPPAHPPAAQTVSDEPHVPQVTVPADPGRPAQG